LHYAKQQYADADKYLTIAREAAVKSGEIEKIVESSIYAGKTLSVTNKEEQAYSSLLNAALISTRFNLTKFNWEALYELGIYHYTHNKQDSAINYFKRAVELVEKTPTIYMAVKMQRKNMLRMKRRLTCTASW